MALNRGEPLSEMLPPLSDLDIRQVVIAYDRTSDTLMIHFYGRGRGATSVPVGRDDRDFIFARLDRETNKVVGIQIEDFLDIFVRHHPTMVKFLDIAELRGISRDEVQLIQEGLDPDTLRQAMIGSLLSELAAAAA